MLWFAPKSSCVGTSFPRGDNIGSKEGYLGLEAEPSQGVYCLPQEVAWHLV